LLKNSIFKSKIPKKPPYIDALINPYVTYNNPKIGPKNQNQPKIIVIKKLLHVRFTFLDNLKMKGYLSKTPLIK